MGWLVLLILPYFAHQLADDEGGTPEAQLQRDIYIWMISTRAATLKGALKIQNDKLLGICTASGFPLKKWAVNRDKLFISISEEDRA